MVYLWFLVHPWGVVTLLGALDHLGCTVEMTSYHAQNIQQVEPKLSGPQYEIV